MKKFQCTVCGHIYNPLTGEPTQNIPPGTPFENLSESWTCPICGAEKSRFKEL